MRLDHVEESRNVEDRRSAGPRKAAMGGGLIGVVMLVVIVLAKGGNIGDIIKGLMQQQAQQGQVAANNEPDPVRDAAEEKQRQLVAKVLGLTETVWNDQFQTLYDQQYVEPKLEVFRGSTQTACGAGEAAMGPFYCPADEKVYIDLSFYDQLAGQLKAKGDFAQAYVVAHEVGHHVQNQLGYSEIVHRARQEGRGEREVNELSVRLELQADYLAGVWAYQSQKEFKILEQGDVEEGLNAAFQIGDDTLQKRSTGRVVIENFTHGSSEQRVRWFREGMRTGDASRKALDRFFDLPYSKL
ncbi:MAG: neutral zinc metallopeptidase [Planctomycetaceae bacterium]